MCLFLFADPLSDWTFISSKAAKGNKGKAMPAPKEEKDKAPVSKTDKGKSSLKSPAKAVPPWVSFFSLFFSIIEHDLDIRAIELGKDTVHLADVEMYRVTYVCFCKLLLHFKWLILRLHSVPEGLKKCKIQPRSADLDEKLRETYKGLPKLPRYSPLFFLCIYIYHSIF